MNSVTILPFAEITFVERIAMPNSKKASNKPIRETEYMKMPKFSGPNTRVEKIKKMNQNGFTIRFEKKSQEVLFRILFLIGFFY